MIPTQAAALHYNLLHLNSNSNNEVQWQSAVSQQGHHVKGDGSTGSRSTPISGTAFSRSQIKRTISAKLSGQQTPFR